MNPLALQDSPFWKLVGLTIASLEESGAVLELPVKEELKQIFGQVQGGVVAAMADAAMSTAVHGILSQQGKRATTIELKINYLRPVTEGKLVAYARVVHWGKSIAVSQANIKNSQGSLVATATSTSLILTT